VNSYATSKYGDHTEWKRLTRAFPLLGGYFSAPKGELKVKTSAHCECTISAHMFQKFQKANPKVFEIGTSKRPCFLCQKYIEFLVGDIDLTSSMRFIISGYQGKVRIGWKPPDGPPNALSGIIRFLEHEVDKILDTVAHKP